ncbi:M1 family metallopeptidase [Pseudoduganella plicata]|uniref:Aminopeptidase n=1 Tax=Pseudoduganella plicata TaxID=321984 RepID=A0A4P7BEE3_9BURK|nr:M1 family metallopeptidase [Pseudoduganella plicata]QBQ36620.1 M1 family peptidase [Pseudoduganella plicata]GGY73938.1 aminopeptidase [Pseudoduganella plicata]
MKRSAIAGITVLLCTSLHATAADKFDDKFRQLDELLPTATPYRTASGAPGHQYWQQRADYTIRATLDEANRTVTGAEQITYHNNSPDTLAYLWVQLDQNIYKPDSDARRMQTAPSREAWTKPRGEDGAKYEGLRSTLVGREFDGGFRISNVRTSGGAPLQYVVNGTMMRIDLPSPLKPGERVTFGMEWTYKVNEQKVLGGRSGYEYFEEDKNTLFEIAQWYPRMAAYYDVAGWQHKQFLGSGEFTLEFGDYDVRITVPADHVVASTGELQNPGDVLSATQRQRLEQAKTAKKPVVIVTQAEAEAAEKAVSKANKTWHFKAKNVRDFAWASSRKFIWDAQGYKKDGTNVLAMSYYPKEGNPLWEKYSTASIIHTIEQYNKYSFDYPYPTAISVNGPVGGMEYPMISFNGPRPTKDKKTGQLTYSKRAKYGLISVIVHEVGHNYFPMIVNSDERQWTWMDEGLNSFVEYLAVQAWEKDFPIGRGDPRDIVNYMRSANQVPIMTNSESLLQFGNNAYAKPATALNILRETILGRELFDHAFREYARRWKFKRPTPADFFRTMEDASGTDLDWFWRGWFYTTDAVDISLDNIGELTVDTKNPEVEKAWARARKAEEPVSITDQRNASMPRRIDTQPELRDFYNEHDEFTVTNADRNKYKEATADLEPWQKNLLAQGKYLYLVDFTNKGGLVMPLILEITLKSGKKYVERVPAEVWRYSPAKITKLLVTDEPMTSLTQDPYWETADIDTSNNSWPRKAAPSRLELFKAERKVPDMMKDFNTPLKADDKDAKDGKAGDKPAATPPANGAAAKQEAEQTPLKLDQPKPAGKQ